MFTKVSSCCKSAFCFSRDGKHETKIPKKNRWKYPLI